MLVLVHLGSLGRHGNTGQCRGWLADGVMLSPFVNLRDVVTLACRYMRFLEDSIQLLARFCSPYERVPSHIDS